MKAKIFYVSLFLIFSMFMSGFAGPVLAKTNTADQLRAQIESPTQQITALIKQLIQTQIAEIHNKTISQPLMQTTSPQTQYYTNTTNNGHATLTVTATGVVAYISINNGPQFVYSSPITLNNGDSYSVTASLNNSGSNSTSKCNGKVSSGGNYTCNVSINQH